MSPTVRAVFHRVLTNVGIAGLDRILIDQLGELYGQPEPVDATVDAMTVRWEPCRRAMGVPS